MQRGLVEGVGRAELGHAAQVHHGDAVGQVADHGQVVGDEEVGEAVGALQLGQQVDHLALDGDVEGGHGLVAHDQAGLEGERPGDADALALATGELVRVALGHAGVERHLVQQLGHAGAGGGAAAADAVHQQRFGDDLAHGHARVERAVRVLEDDLDGAAQGAERAAVHGSEASAADADLAGGGGLERQQQAADGALAAAGFAHEAEGLARGDGEADILDGADRGTAGADGEMLGEAVDCEQRGGFAGRRGLGQGGLLGPGQAGQLVAAPAGGALRGAMRNERRLFGAAVDREGAAGCEPAPGRQRHQVRR